LAPDLKLLDLRNQRVPLSSLRGKVVILNFWYAACEPCVVEMPTLEAVYRAQLGKGLVVIGINTSDDAQTITDFLRRLGITYPILRDVGQRAVVAYAVIDTPTSFILDRRGVIRYKYAGPLDRATLNQDIPPLLQEAAP
jgi:peroxiredoxin